MSGVAVVTGAGRGIGRAIAIELAARGRDVALLGRTESDIEEAAAAVSARGRRAGVVRCDVSRAADVDAAWNVVLRDLGTPEIVVNNAGTVVRKPVVDMTEADWDGVVDASLK